MYGNGFPPSWKRICGLRDVLVHDYRGVNLRVVWNAVTNEVPELRAALDNRDGGT